MGTGYFFAGLLLLIITLLLYRAAASAFESNGLLLWDSERRRTLPENLIEFLLSLFLSLMASAGISFFFVGLAGIFGANIQVP